METLDRKIAPAFKAVDKINIAKASEQRLNNNIPVYSINAGTQDLIKIEFIFSAGIYQQSIPLQAVTANAMLEEGTSKFSASEIADKIDNYGAFLETSVTQDNASVVLYSLNKHLKATLPIVEEVIKNSIFPQEEVDTFLRNRKQRFHVNNQKVGYVARKQFAELIFGKNHPYGINVQETDFDAISRNDLLKFYRVLYCSNDCKIILAGKVDDQVIELLEKHFGGNDWEVKPTTEGDKGKLFEGNPNAIQIASSHKMEHLVYKEDALQSAIRIGKVMFNKKHPDFQSLQVLNTVFGGYFGSRLMSNIREDKGYTYGIGSGLVSYKNAGYFFISTEVGVDVCNLAINEIYHEMNRLREVLVGEDELGLVKNYLLGRFLRSVDGPFAIAERFKGLMEYDLGYNYLDEYIATIKSTTASQLRDLANQYFDKDSLIELVVGKK